MLLRIFIKQLEIIFAIGVLKEYLLPSAATLGYVMKISGKYYAGLSGHRSDISTPRGICFFWTEKMEPSPFLSFASLRNSGITRVRNQFPYEGFE